MAACERLPPNAPFPDESFDAVLLFAVLTCLPADDDQRAVINELHRLTRPGGLLYVSDYWLQTDERNQERYAQFEAPHHEARGTEEVVGKTPPISPSSSRQPPPSPYGVFEVSGGVTVRHHSRQWIDSLLYQWEPLAASDIQVTTMNGHEAAGFQWLGRKENSERRNGI